MAYFVISLKKTSNKDCGASWLQEYHFSFTGDMYGPFSNIWKAIRAAKDLPKLLSSEDSVIRCVIIRGNYFLIDGHNVLGFFGIMLAIYLFLAWPIGIYRNFISRFSKK
jgi:hypothetical protein